jgi:hypothetical protein
MSTARAALIPALTQPMRSWVRCSGLGRRPAFTVRQRSSTALQSSASAEHTCSSARPSSRCVAGSARSGRRDRYACRAPATSVKASSAARAIPIGTAPTAASTNGISGNA